MDQFQFYHLAVNLIDGLFQVTCNYLNFSAKIIQYFALNQSIGDPECWNQVFYRSICIIWNKGVTKFFITCLHPCHSQVLTFAAWCLSWFLSADTGRQPGSSGMLSWHHTKSGMNIYGSLNGVEPLQSSIGCPWWW